MANIKFVPGPIQSIHPRPNVVSPVENPSETSVYKRPTLLRPPPTRPQHAAPGLVVGGPRPVSHASGPAYSQDPEYSHEAQVRQLDRLMRESRPEAVQEAVRNNMERCLMGSEAARGRILDFVLNIVDAPTARAVMVKSGRRLVSDCREEIVTIMGPPMMDEMADVIVPRMGFDFLDKCLAERLTTISAGELVDLLVRANRLCGEHGFLEAPWQPSTGLGTGN